MLQNSLVVTVLADESKDSSNLKRLVLYAQIINESMQPSTHYITNVECTDSTGKGIAKCIKHELESRNIQLDKVMSFGSDGAFSHDRSQKWSCCNSEERQPPHDQCSLHQCSFLTKEIMSSRDSHCWKTMSPRSGVMSPNFFAIELFNKNIKSIFYWFSFLLTSNS